jgi:hypothetical protein
MFIIIDPFTTCVSFDLCMLIYSKFFTLVAVNDAASRLLLVKKLSCTYVPRSNVYFKKNRVCIFFGRACKFL